MAKYIKYLDFKNIYLLSPGISGKTFLAFSFTVHEVHEMQNFNVQMKLFISLNIKMSL